MRDAAPQTIYLADYTPYGFIIDDVALHFDLDPRKTRVKSRISFRPNPDASDHTFFLHGENLSLVSAMIDGTPVSPEVTPQGLTCAVPNAPFVWEAEVEIDPMGNTALEGLYMSNGMYCTQCEAEGFRNITYYPDRPDVMAVFTVTINGPHPVLLSNGNPVSSGKDTAEWRDPWPKPAYLFALVAGDLVAHPGSFTTKSGRKVDLNLYVRPGDEGKCAFGMQALKDSMKWDEDVYGREYDLDLFNIVAVDDFNMGAMENKGLNIFNSSAVLASPETSTDMNFERIEAIIAHEYFHNWTGNRITCRDWFQLCLKEGLTVYRDHAFSADQRSAAVKRIAEIRLLKAHQFPEDAGPLAHPVRPESYKEINNFYTATVYEKGSEVVRMIRTILGAEDFRKGMDLYFERHDGQAATIEDFLACFAEASGRDLTQFALWYSQAGTPKVSVTTGLEGSTAIVDLSQEIPATPGQDEKQPMPIPLRIALFDRETGTHRGEELIVLDKAKVRFTFDGFDTEPVLSINRGFTAPVGIERDIARADLAFLAAKDDDPFARYEALQDLVTGHLVEAVGGGLSDSARDEARGAIGDAFEAILNDATLDDQMRGELLILPSQTYLAEQMLVADPGRIFEEREGLKAWLGRALASNFDALYERAAAAPGGREAEAVGARKVKTLALSYIAAADPDRAEMLATRQYDAADTMTDRQGALMVLSGLEGLARTDRLAAFYERYRDNPLALDKWFAIQASSLHPNVVEQVKALAEHPDFTLRNPNRVRSLYMAFAGTAQGFHASSGEGYRMIADLILALDPINPQTAARFVPPLGRWQRMEPNRAALMKEQLERIAAAPKLSRDTYEQVTRSLG